QQQVDAAQQDEVRLPLPETLTGEVGCHQRGRAGGVHRQAGPAEVKEVGNAVGGDAQSAADAGVGVYRMQVFELQVAIFVIRDADENPSLAASELRGYQAGVLDGLPGQFEEQAVLRADARSLTGRNAEEVSVEAVDALKKAAGARAALPGQAGIGVVIGVHL